MRGEQVGRMRVVKRFVYLRNQQCREQMICERISMQKEEVHL